MTTLSMKNTYTISIPQKNNLEKKLDELQDIFYWLDYLHNVGYINSPTERECKDRIMKLFIKIRKEALLDMANLILDYISNGNKYFRHSDWQIGCDVIIKKIKEEGIKEGAKRLAKQIRLNNQDADLSDDTVKRLDALLN